MLSTPPSNSLTSAAIKAKNLRTPFSPRIADRDKGNKYFRRRIDKDMINETRYCQIPVEDFMTNFLPTLPKPFDESDRVPKLPLQTLQGKDESACYPILCTFINKALKKSRFVCKNVSRWPDKALGANDQRRIDLNVYAQATQENLEELCAPWADPDLEFKTKVDEDHGARNSFAHAACGVEVKLDGDGFGTTVETFLPDNKEARLTRGQCCDYAAEVQIRQHRRFFFTVSIYRTTARLMRWDRVGAVISEPIDLQAPEKLYEFFYRLKYATDLQLGLDPTARVIVKDIDNHDSVVAVKAALACLPTSRTKPFIDEAFSDKGWPYYELDVPDKAKPDGTHTFLVRNLSTNSIEVTGRATKGFIAFDVHMNQFCFLKDSWRTDARDVHPELEVYHKLKTSIIPRAPGLATIRCGGDLEEPVDSVSDTEVKYKPQITQTQTFSGLDQHVYYPRVHTRIVLNEVGIPLKHYKDSNELCIAVMVAFNAHAKAWSVAKVLHRDISDGNIVLYEISNTMIGLLIDWDLSKYQDELANTPLQRFRSGTWRYLSATLLRYPLKDNSVADDIESFYHLLMIFALRFHRHGKTPAELKVILEAYDIRDLVNGYWIGSSDKYEHMEEGRLPCKLLDKEYPFALLLAQLFDICKTHYTNLNKMELQLFALDAAETPPATVPIAAPDPYVQGMLENFALDVPNTPSAQHVVPQVAPASNSEKRVLNDHIEFTSALLKALNSSGWYSDKTDDQFAAILWPSDPDDIRTSTRTQTGSKRRIGETGLDSAEAEPSDSKKSKKASQSQSAAPRRTTRSMSKAGAGPSNHQPHSE